MESVKEKTWYDQVLESAERNYPHLKDIHCPKCGLKLVRGSIGYYKGHHFDGCPTSKENE